MKRTAMILAGILTFLFGMSSVNVHAAEMNENKPNYPDTGIGGMSALIDSYYQDVLSETGISISNAVTTLNVGGEALEKVERVSGILKDIAVAKVNDYVNIRSDASTQAEVVGRLYADGIVTVIADQGEWIHIISNGIEGYIKSDYLYLGERALKAIDDKYVKYAQATCTTLNIRGGVGTEYRKVGSIAQGEQVEVLEDLGEWVKVAVDSETGYVHKSYVDYVYDFKYAVDMEAALRIDEQRKYDASHMVWPMPSDHRIYTYYGYRVAPTKGASTFHKGLDIGGAKGAKIVAVLSGTVTVAEYSSSSGYYIEINHGNGIRTRYLHNSKLLVSVGQRVNQGDVISLCGSSGISTGAHLHFSVIKNGNYVDPYPYLKNVH